MSGIKRYSLSECGGLFIDEEDGHIIDYSDHLASHAFDEAVERAAFEAEYTQPSLIKRNKCGVYQYDSVRYAWGGWTMCAKSRAKRFGGDV